jgi:hypothetical protein
MKAKCERRKHLRREKKLGMEGDDHWEERHSEMTKCSGEGEWEGSSGEHPFPSFFWLGPFLPSLLLRAPRWINSPHSGHLRATSSTHMTPLLISLLLQGKKNPSSLRPSHKVIFRVVTIGLHIYSFQARKFVAQKSDLIWAIQNQENIFSPPLLYVLLNLTGLCLNLQNESPRISIFI